MTVASYTSDLTDIFLFESVTGVSAYGGGASGLGASPDYAIEGTNAVDKQVSAAEKGFLYAAGAAFTIGADDHFFIWAIVGVPGLADTRDNRGIVVNIGDDTSNFVKFHVNGNDTLPKGGLVPYAIRFVNTTLTNFRTLVGSPGTSPDNIGVGANITGSAKFSNLAADAARIGTGYDILNGTGADPEADFAGIASDDESTAEGVFQTVGGGYNLQGKLRIGSASTACEFNDVNTNIFIVDTIHSLADFTEILIENASSIFTLTNVNFNALGTNNPGRLEMITSTASLVFNNVGFIGFGLTVLGTGASLVGCRWVGADIVTANGADLTGSSISDFEGTANTSPLIWDVATNPNGLLDDMSFTKGTAATHAIEFGATSPLSMTITGIDFSGYNASNGQNDSALHIKRTSGTVNITVSGGSGTVSYRTDGATVNILADVTVTFDKMKDDTEVRVYEHVSVENTDISFTATDTIASAGSEFGVFAADDIIRISGSGNNDAEFRILTASASTLTVTPGSITTESAGANVFIKKTNQVEIDGIEDATAGSADDRNFSWSSPASTVVDYVIHHWSGAAPFYKTIRVNGYVVPAADTTIDINQLINRNAT